MPSVMEMFRNVVGLPVTTASTVQPAAVVDPASVIANTTVPSSATAKSDGSLGAIPAAGEGDKSPLDKFSELWQIDPNVPKQKTAAELVPKFKVDPKALSEAAATIDFTKALDPALLTKAAGGDATALAAVVNAAAQAGYAQATGTTAGLINEALSSQAKTFNEEVMPAVLRKHNITNALKADNPTFSDPAAAPLISMVEQQLTIKYPKASPAEISAHAKDFLAGFAESVVTANGSTIVKPAVEKPGTKRGITDWTSYFGETG